MNPSKEEQNSRKEQSGNLGGIGLAFLCFSADHGDERYT